MELLEKHFDIAFDATDGIKRLRELILTLAMQGKLVPQDPSDQPACALLKEIEAEKKRLAKAGKIKAPKPLPEIKTEEVPYELPKGWEWVRLGEIIELISGQHLSPNEYNEDKVGFSYYTGPADFGTHSPKASRWTTVDRAIAADGDILLTVKGAGVGKTNILEEEKAAISRQLMALRVLLVNKVFVLRFLTTIFYELQSLAVGIAIPGISREDVLLRKFPLPPLAEQRRIVAKIDQLMARCDELEKLRAEREQKRLDVHTAALNRLLAAQEPNSFSSAWHFITDRFGELYSVPENVAELRKAILQLAVMGKLVPQDPTDQPATELLKEIETEKKRLVKAGKVKAPKPLPEIKPEEVPYELPQGWEWVRLGTIGFTNIGLTYSPSEVSETGIPVLRSNNIQNGKLDLSDLKRVNMDVKESVLVQQGDLIICARNGSKALVGKTALITSLNETMAFGAFMAIFRSSLNDYLLHFINSPLFRRLIDEVNTMTINQITQENLRSTICPLPPIAEQRRIAAKIDELMVLCDELDRQILAVSRRQTKLLNAVMSQV